MNEKKMVHNDIKYNNIVMHNDVFKYIDFGLSELSSKKQHFKNRSLDELNTGRIYLFYSLDYLLYYANKHQLNQEVSNIENGMFIISLKSFLQNITLGNETNLGFKVVSNEKNDPFESINFDIENESAKPILEIIYVAN